MNEKLQQTQQKYKRLYKNYERLYTTKFSNLKEMDKFLKIYNLITLNHEESENLNKLSNSKEIETIMKNLQKTKSSGQDGSTMNSTKHSKF